MVFWTDRINLILGENGSGKTNLLEALNVLGGWGPFEGRKTSSMVSWDGTLGAASLIAEVSGEEKATCMARLSGRTILRWNGKILLASEVRRRLPCLAFLSEHLLLLEGGASVRRHLIDLVCALLFPPYAYRLHEYRRAVRQRIACLKLGRDPEITIETLVPLAAWIWKAREGAVRLLEEGLERSAYLLPRPVSIAFKRGGGGLLDDPVSDYRASMEKNRAKEKAAGFPFTGPHRDDLEIVCQGRPAVEVLSRGHRRRTAIALMMAAASSVEKALKRAPVMLLDEVAAELDERGRQVLFESLERTGWQVFAATAEKGLSPKGAALYQVRFGKVEKMG